MWQEKQETICSTNTICGCSVRIAFGVLRTHCLFIQNERCFLRSAADASTTKVQQHRREDFWRLLGTILGGILGTFGGPFGHILGVRSALGRKCLIKGGVVFWCRRFLLIFEKKIKILGPEKGSQIGPKMAPKKVAKKSLGKTKVFNFL